MGEGAVKTGWFSTPGRPGDRTLADQMKGLDWLLNTCLGKTVLDVGCAEGLISIELAKRGAIVHGVEIVPQHVKVAQRLTEELAWDETFKQEIPVFSVTDANTWVPEADYDIVIMLAVLHKLKNPSLIAYMLAQHAKEAVVVRLPPGPAPVVIDARSGNKRHSIDKALKSAGFEFAGMDRGHFNEWVGIYKRTS
jgi:SAM-dependent methyltransferase